MNFECHWKRTELVGEHRHKSFVTDSMRLLFSEFYKKVFNLQGAWYPPKTAM